VVRAHDACGGHRSVNPVTESPAVSLLLLAMAGLTMTLSSVSAIADAPARFDHLRCRDARPAT
jgi:hypothetical protein